MHNLILALARGTLKRFDIRTKFESRIHDTRRMIRNLTKRKMAIVCDKLIFNLKFDNKTEKKEMGIEKEKEDRNTAYA